jgi:predicted ATPase
VGKTALVRAFTETIEGDVLTGACEPQVTPAPLGPIVAAVRRKLSARTRGEAVAAAAKLDLL